MKLRLNVSMMERLERMLSRPVAKPYRSSEFIRERPYLDHNGHVSFAPDDIENPKNWSTARRWYITVIAVLLVVNATFSSSSPSGSLKVRTLPVLHWELRC